ncbi:MAG: sulfotransferase family protein [Rhodanobacteraceae bacterium]
MNPCILVFGMPRSGTTWIGKLFDSHPDTLYRHEPDSVQRLTMPLFPEKADALHYHVELEQFVRQLPWMRSPEVVGKQPLFPKNYQSSAELAVYRASVLTAKAASRIRRHFPCPYRPTAEGYAKTHVVWKSIESTGRLYACIDVLPDARSIYLLRHPCGYVASVLRGEAAHRFGDSTPGADELWLLELLLATDTGRKYGLTMDELVPLTPEERLAWRWTLIQENALANVAGSDRVLTVRYEDVCAEPIAMTRRMFGFAGLDWHPQTERFVLASTGADDSGYYSVFKNSRASAERWQTELAQDVIERIQRILRGSTLRRFYNDESATAEALPEAVA